jgi:nucleoside-diphosphate-sugar epimerase
VTAPPLEGARVLVTGATGQVGAPVARALAGSNEVIALARFRDPAAKEPLERAGARCVAVDLATADFAEAGVPADVDYVLNFAVAKTGRIDRDLAASAEAIGLLMAHCRSATAVLHCSSTAVYAPRPHHPHAETDPLGENGHRVLLPTYTLVKVAAEAVARTAARQLDLPTTIARLNVPYGDEGGWPLFHLLMMAGGQPIPVHADAPSTFNPIHEDDIVRTIPGLLAAASVPATVVNWGGHDEVSVEDWCAHLGSLTGLTPSFEPSPEALESVVIDRTRMVELAGDTVVDWREGLHRMVVAKAPELLNQP